MVSLESNRRSPSFISQPNDFPSIFLLPCGTFVVTFWPFLGSREFPVISLELYQRMGPRPGYSGNKSGTFAGAMLYVDNRWLAEGSLSRRSPRVYRVVRMSGHGLRMRAGRTDRDWRQVRNCRQAAGRPVILPVIFCRRYRVESGDGGKCEQGDSDRQSRQGS